MTDKYKSPDDVPVGETVTVYSVDDYARPLTLYAAKSVRRPKTFALCDDDRNSKVWGYSRTREVRCVHVTEEAAWEAALKTHQDVVTAACEAIAVYLPLCAEAEDKMKKVRGG